MREPKLRNCGSGRTGGFSLPELLAVLALIAIAVGIGIPIVNEQVRIAEVRAAADDLALHVRAARMISVTKHETITFEVYVDPDNYYRYGSRNDAYWKWKRINTPDRVRIAPASDRIFNLKDNGSVDVACSIVLESEVSGARERWTTSVNTMGMTTLVHERVN